MKRLVWVLCFGLIASLSAQSQATAREALRIFAWPDTVQQELLKNWQRGGTPVVLSQARIMNKGWSVVDNNQYAYCLLPAGTVVEVWRLTNADGNWFLLWEPQQQTWYVNEDVMPIIAESNNPVSVKVKVYDFSLNYYYEQRTFIQPDFYDLAWLQLNRSVLDGLAFRIKLGGGLGIRHATESVGYKFLPLQRITLQVSWYSPANIWHWFSNNALVNESWREQKSQYIETYQQFSYDVFHSRHWLMTADYFGSQDLDKRWLYVQGSMAIHFVWPLVYARPHFSIGWCWQSANMSNIWNERQQWRPRTGDLVINYDSRVWWAQMQYGWYQRVMGQSGIVTSKNNQPRFSLAAGAHIF